MFEESAKTQFAKRKLEKKKKLYVERVEKTARAEILRSEDHGCVFRCSNTKLICIFQILRGRRRRSNVHRQAEGHCCVGGHRQCNQGTRVVSVNLGNTVVLQHFELNLDKFGPYRIDYTRN